MATCTGKCPPRFCVSSIFFDESFAIKQWRLDIGLAFPSTQDEIDLLSEALQAVAQKYAKPPSGNRCRDSTWPDRRSG